MGQITLSIAGIKREQANEFIEDLKTIEGVEQVKTIFELSQIEFKSLCVPIVIFIKDVSLEL